MISPNLFMPSYPAPCFEPFYGTGQDHLAIASWAGLDGATSLEGPITWRPLLIYRGVNG